MTLVQKLNEITDREQVKLDASLRAYPFTGDETGIEQRANVRDVAIWEALHAIAERLDEDSR